MSADIFPVIVLPSSAYTASLVIWPPATFTADATPGFNVLDPNAGVADTVAGFGSGFAAVAVVDDAEERDDVEADEVVGSGVGAAAAVG